MRNFALEDQIIAACRCPMSQRDFTEQEQAYILGHQPFQDELLFWFAATCSDGCWTAQTVKFLRSCSSLPKNLPAGREEDAEESDEIVF